MPSKPKPQKTAPEWFLPFALLAFRVGWPVYRVGATGDILVVETTAGVACERIPELPSWIPERDVDIPATTFSAEAFAQVFLDELSGHDGAVGRVPTETEFRRDPDRVRWWQSVLSHPFGREIVEIVRAQGPENQLTLDASDDPVRAVALAKLLRETEGTLAGMISGFHSLRKLLFTRLRAAAGTPPRRRMPGEAAVAPHPVSIP